MVQACDCRTISSSQKNTMPHEISRFNRLIAAQVQAFAVAPTPAEPAEDAAPRCASGDTLGHAWPVGKCGDFPIYGAITCNMIALATA